MKLLLVILGCLSAVILTACSGDESLGSAATPDRVVKLDNRPSNSGCVAPDNASDVATTLTDSNCFLDVTTQTMADGVIPYTVNSVLWSDGESKGRYFAIPDGLQITLKTDASFIVPTNGIENGDFDFPVGSVIIKHFYSGTRIVETRYLMNHASDGWAGYSYEWNFTQTEGTLLTNSKQITSPVRHYFPSQAECMQCHTNAALVVLGPDTLQLNYTLYYTDGSEENYLDALDRLQFFTAAPLPAYKDNKLYAINDSGASLEQKARSYLHSNCSGCHRTGAPEGGYGDMRYNSLFTTAAMNVCGIDRTLVSSPANGKLIDPGNANNSTVYQRLSSTDSIKMPPIGREDADPTAVSVMEQWINGLSDCN